MNWILLKKYEWTNIKWQVDSCESYIRRLERKVEALEKYLKIKCDDSATYHKHKLGVE